MCEVVGPDDGMVMVFTAGHNMAGYLPESDVYSFGSFDEAKSYVISELLHVADHAAGYGDDEEDEAYATELTHAAEDLNLVSGPEWGTSVDCCGRFDQSWWISVVVMSADEAQEAFDAEW
jgi:hypothetical protein